MQAIGGAIEEFDRRYSAFISYRHVPRDRQWAKWLVETLESYRTPKALVKKGFAARIGPMYRDEDENPASAELGDQIEKALAASDTLIVVASRDTPGSSWIDREVRLFQEMGKGDRILVLLVDGDPAQSYPPSLLKDPDKEPIAADVRPREDEPEKLLKHRAKLRIAAALLRCAYDDLAQRDRQRTRRRRTWIGAGSAVALLLAGLTVFGIAQQREILRLDRTALNIQNELRGASSNAPEKEFAMFAALSDSAWPYVRVTPRAEHILFPRAAMSAVHTMRLWKGSLGATVVTTLDDGQIMLGAGDGSVYLAEPNRLIRSVSAADCQAAAIVGTSCAVSAMAGHNKRLAIGSANGILRIFGGSNQTLTRIEVFERKIDRLFWTNEGKLLISDESGAIFEINGYNAIKPLALTGGAVVKFLPSNSGLAIVVRANGLLERLFSDGRLEKIAHYGAVLRDAHMVNGKLLLLKTALLKGFGETEGEPGIFWGSLEKAKRIKFDDRSHVLMNDPDLVIQPMGEQQFFYGAGASILRGDVSANRLSSLEVGVGIMNFTAIDGPFTEFKYGGSFALSLDGRWLYSVEEYSNDLLVLDLKQYAEIENLFATSTFLKRDLCKTGLAYLYASRSGESQKCP